MLKMTGICKAYRSEILETFALRDLSIHVREGEFIAVTGPSGCGKTTFLTIAGMLESFNEGEYEFDGVNVYAVAIPAPQCLGQTAAGGDFLVSSRAFGQSQLLSRGVVGWSATTLSRCSSSCRFAAAVGG